MFKISKMGPRNKVNHFQALAPHPNSSSWTQTKSHNYTIKMVDILPKLHTLHQIIWKLLTKTISKFGVQVTFNSWQQHPRSNNKITQIHKYISEIQIRQFREKESQLCLKHQRPCQLEIGLPFPTTFNFTRQIIKGTWCNKICTRQAQFKKLNSWEWKARGKLITSQI